MVRRPVCGSHPPKKMWTTGAFTGRGDPRSRGKARVSQAKPILLNRQTTKPSTSRDLDDRPWSRGWTTEKAIAPGPRTTTGFTVCGPFDGSGPQLPDHAETGSRFSAQQYQ
uniref:Uncharacterized protein n=1 Tax=Solanum tuberosum TaxID=4113 RepID=M1DWZ5_SOLTU